MTSPSISRQRQTADQVIAAFNTWDIDSVMAFRSEDCIHEVLPKSLGREPMNNDAFRAYFSSIMPFFKGFTATVHEIVESEKERKILMWASSVADSVIGPYHNEYCLVLFFNEEGDKVVRFLEFVDSKWSVEFFGKLRVWIAEQEKAKEVMSG